MINNMQKEMENYEIKVDAICQMPSDLYSSGFINLMKDILIEEKKKIDSEYEDLDHQKALYKGSRFLDNDHLTRVALGAIYYSISRHIRTKNQLTWEEIESKSSVAVNDWIVNQCEVSELRRIAKDTILYSMSSDHWYTFEKDWG